ncbi:hypothetical protein PVAND_003804 [Polypedilum vanderplanki]|uniref:Uncharacterized protein n=1 Tax=Polypedilum vanderplanki TaxID=319348 RepID=A0A9J6BVP2_POLVA|nr:hypothetical protein PVAND_003804 [Polypedilum vanderplanki]
MKSLILLISTIFILVHSAEVNETKRSTDGQVLQSNPEPLVNLQTIKNSTKDAADRIFKLITSNKEEEIVTTTEKSEGFKPLFTSFNTNQQHNNGQPQLQPFSIFGLHKSPERPIKSFEERLCTCKPEYSIPTLPSFSSPSSDFNSRNIPTFEVIYPSKEYFPNPIETPIISQYPPLDLNNLWKYQESSIQSSSLNDNL